MPARYSARTTPAASRRGPPAKRAPRRSGPIMLNFAAFRYRAVMAVAGGPIERLELSDTTVLGQREFLASAFLRAGLGDDGARFETCIPASGSGTAASPMVARFMALSEALERWAHWQLHSGAAGVPYGFAADPSSNGM